MRLSLTRCPKAGKPGSAGLGRPLQTDAAGALSGDGERSTEKGREESGMSSEALAEALLARGYQLTEARRTVLTAISAWSGCFSSRDLCRKLQAERSGVGRATVFRTLNLLLELGLLERIRGTDDVERYLVTYTGDHHHHLICSSCGWVEELPECPVADKLAELAAARHFQMKSHSLEVYGLCERCAGKRPGQSSK